MKTWKKILGLCMTAGVAGLTAAAAPEAPAVAECATILKKPLLTPAQGKLGFDAVLKEVTQADLAADAGWRALKSRAEYDRHRQTLREKYVQAIGGLKFDRTPLNPKVVATVPREGYRIEKVMFESRPGVYVTALVYLPDAAKFKPPYKAIVLTCGHSAEGKGSIDYQRGCVQGALEGFVVLIYDPISQGERVQSPGGRCCIPHNRYGALATLLGQSTAEMRIWDGLRVIDYLYTRDDVRKDGVGCMGNSGGGTMTSLLEAIDPRITAACPSCYLTTLRDACAAIGPQDAEQNVFGQLAFGLNHAGYVLLGDNAVRMHCCFNDFFPIGGSRATFAVVQDTAKACGLDLARYGMTDVPGPHGWKESTRSSSIQWMRRWLAGDKNTPPVNVEACRRLDVGFNVKKVDHGLDGKAAWVTPAGAVAKVPGFRCIHDYLIDDLAAAEKGRVARDAAALAKVVAARAGIRPLEAIGFTVKETDVVALAKVPGAKAVREVFTFADGQQVPAITFLPAGTAKGAILVVDDRADRAIHRARVLQALQAGRAIMVADLASVGETGKKRFEFYGMKNMDEGPAVMLYLLGKSLVGVRAEELLVLGSALKRRSGTAVELVPHGRPCISAAHARAVRPDLFSGVTCLRTPESWAKSVRAKAMIPYANVVYGALLDYDWTDLVK